jgi:hypothetical protein
MSYHHQIVSICLLLIKHNLSMYDGFFMRHCHTKCFFFCYIPGFRRCPASESVRVQLYFSFISQPPPLAPKSCVVKSCSGVQWSERQKKFFFRTNYETVTGPQAITRILVLRQSLGFWFRGGVWQYRGGRTQPVNDCHEPNYWVVLYFLTCVSLAKWSEKSQYLCRIKFIVNRCPNKTQTERKAKHIESYLSII